MMLSLHELEDCIKPSPSVEEEYAINEIGRILNEYLETLISHMRITQVGIFILAEFPG